MGPDEKFPTIAGAGQVFFAPVGTELPADGDLAAAGFQPLTFLPGPTWIDETHEQMQRLGDAIQALGDAALMATLSFKLTSEPSSTLVRLFWFGERRPKAIRRWYDSLLLAERRQARADRRDAQRRAMGIGLGSMSAHPVTADSDKPFTDPQLESLERFGITADALNLERTTK